MNIDDTCTINFVFQDLHLFLCEYNGKFGRLTWHPFPNPFPIANPDFERLERHPRPKPMLEDMQYHFIKKT